MTENQLKYLAYQESLRHNLATEGQASAELEERIRANKAAEFERGRSNRVSETETQRANLVREAEAERTNRSNEFIKRMNTAISGVKTYVDIRTQPLKSIGDILSLTQKLG